MNLIEHIISDLKNHHRDKLSLLEYYVNARLNKSFSSYYEDLLKSKEYLEQRKNKLKVMKNINRD